VNRHEEARTILLDAFGRVFGRSPSLAEIQAVQAVALLETGYGRGWKGTGRGSNNWGAITTTRPDSLSFEHRDSRRDAGTGEIVEYVTWFRGYPSPVDGAADLVSVMYVRRPSVLEAAKAADLYGVSRELRETSYYLGTAPTREGQIGSHFDRMQESVEAISAGLGEPNAFAGEAISVPGGRGGFGLGLLALMGLGGAVWALSRRA